MRSISCRHSHMLSAWLKIHHILSKMECKQVKLKYKPSQMMRERKKEAQTKNLMQTDRYHACFSTECIVIVWNGMRRHGIIHNQIFENALQTQNFMIELSMNSDEMVFQDVHSFAHYTKHVHSIRIEIRISRNHTLISCSQDFSHVISYAISCSKGLGC